MDGQLVACSGTSTNPVVFMGYCRLSQFILPLFAVVPFSIEYNFTPSLGMDIPSEPIMMLLFGIGLLLFFQRHFTVIFPTTAIR